MVMNKKEYEQMQQYKEYLDEIEEILNIYFDDDWKATRQIENVISRYKNG